MDTLKSYLNPLYLLRFVVLAGLYIATARFGLNFGAVSGFAAFIWLPTAISMIALYLYGYKLWPAVFISAFVVNFWTGAPIIAALGIALGNSLEALLGVYFINTLSSGQEPLIELGDVLRFILFVAFISTLVSATIGVFSLWVTGVVMTKSLFSTWGAWWLGDILSVLIVFPVFITWLLRDPKTIKKTAMAEGIVVFLLTAGSNFIVFWSPLHQYHVAPLLYLIFPPLVWSTIRFGVLGTTINIFTTAGIATLSTVLNHGPFFDLPLDHRLFYLQLFMAVTAITFLIFSAIVEEREVTIEENAELLEESRKAVVTRDVFINIASHELKTPITSIKIYAELLEHLHRQSRNDLIGQTLPKMNEQINRIVLLIEDLLNVSRIELGRLELRCGMFDANMLVKDIVSDLQSISLPHIINITGKIERPVWGDKDRIGQVVINLLNNAIKYSPNTNHIEVRLHDGNETARITVKDGGIGIDEEDIDKVFNRFYRASTTNKTYPGLGVGLYISQEIIRRHGSVIEVESALGKGSEFSFTLPYTEIPELA